MKKFLAILLSIVMLLSMGVVGFSAFAADSADEISYNNGILTFNSTMNLSSNGVSAPNVTYTYTLSDGDAGYYVYNNTNSSEAYLFPEDIENYNIESNYFNVENSDNGDIADCTIDAITAGVVEDDISEEVVFTTGDYANDDHYVEKTVNLDLTNLTFDDVGIYHYYLTETTDDEVAGLQEWFTVRELYITVTHDGEDGFAIDNIAMYTRIATDWTIGGTDHAYYQSVKNSGFYHAYGIGGTDEFVMVSMNDGYTQDAIGAAVDELLSKQLSEAGLYGQDFVVTLTAFGDMASTSKEFAFATVTANVDIGAVFEVVDGDGVSQYIVQTENGLYFADADNDYAATTDVFTVDLSDGQEYSILSVVEGMEFTVTISDPSYDGYSYYYRDYADSDKDYLTMDIASEMDRTYTITFISGEMESSYEVIGGNSYIYSPEVYYGYNTFLYWEDNNGNKYDEETDFENVSVTSDMTFTAVWERVEWQSGSSYTQTVDDVYADSEITYEMMDYTGGTATAYLDVYSTDNEGIDFAIVKGEDLDETDDLDVGIEYDDAIANTGVILDFAPFMVMVLAAGAYIAMRLVDKRKKQWA